MTAAHARILPGSSVATPGPLRAGVPAHRLRLVPAPPRPAPGRRDLAYAATLAAVLLVGTLGVLLLNTLMQQQAGQIAAERAELARLAVVVQQEQVRLDVAADPRTLAARAAALHLRPATVLVPLAAPVSARGRAAGRGHGG